MTWTATFSGMYLPKTLDNGEKLIDASIPATQEYKVIIKELGRKSHIASLVGGGRITTGVSLSGCQKRVEGLFRSRITEWKQV